MRSAAGIGVLLVTLGGCVAVDRTGPGPAPVEEFASTATAPVVRNIAKAAPQPATPPKAVAASNTNAVKPPVYVVLQPGESGGLPAAEAHLSLPTQTSADVTIVVPQVSETPPVPPSPPSATFAAAQGPDRGVPPAPLPPLESAGPVLADAAPTMPQSEGPQLLADQAVQQPDAVAVQTDKLPLPPTSKPQNLEEITRRTLSAHMMPASGESTPTGPAVSLSGAVEPEKANRPATGPMLAVHEAKAVDPTQTSKSLIGEDSELKIVNSRRVSLQYELKGAAIGEVAGVELWCTRDGRAWVKRDMQPPTAHACSVEVDAEDLYGLSLVVRNVNGVGRTPMNGDRPQVWVEVDLTKPTVRLMGVEPDKEVVGRRYTIRWRAADKNLAAKPISLSFAWQPEGPWTPIVSKIENIGSYVWTPPFDAPSRIYVRVEAADAGGNMGYAQTPDPLEDLSPPPTATIRTVEALDP